MIKEITKMHLENDGMKKNAKSSSQLERFMFKMCFFKMWLTANTLENLKRKKSLPQLVLKSPEGSTYSVSPYHSFFKCFTA